MFCFDVSNIIGFVTFQAVDILRMDYEPSDLDILYAEGVTSSNGLSCVDFAFPQSTSADIIDSGDQHDSLTRLVSVHCITCKHKFMCMCCISPTEGFSCVCGSFFVAVVLNSLIFFLS